MKINELDSSQIATFAKSAQVTHSFMGGRRFEAKMTINGKEEQIVATAKQVYEEIDKQKDNKEIRNDFQNIECPTRNPNEFSKQLNPFQKIYYAIVKFFSGMDYSDLWKSKFLDHHPVYPNVSLDEYVVKAGEKIARALKNIDGSYFNVAMVDIHDRVHGSIGMTENCWGLDHKSSPDPVIWNYFNKNVFYNPKALLILIAGDVTVNGLDSHFALPKDRKCKTYVMSIEEFISLPKLSSEFVKFMEDSTGPKQDIGLSVEGKMNKSYIKLEPHHLK
jgi:hypothetical protein